MPAVEEDCYVPNEFPVDIQPSAYRSQRHLFDRFVRERPSEKSDNINHFDAEIQFRAVEKIYINNLYPRVLTSVLSNLLESNAVASPSFMLRSIV